MMRVREGARLLALTAFIGVAALALPAGQAHNVTALVGGTLIDGFGGRPVRNSVILVEGERISAVGTVGSLAVPAGATVVSTDGMSVLPGLWDKHVHTMLNGHSDYARWDKTYLRELEPTIMPASARQLLLAGVTSARDLGAPLEASVNVRDRLNKGQLNGATLFVSGPFIQHAPYPGTEAFRWGVTGAADATEVRKLADARVDVIKLIDQDHMTMDEVPEVVQEAHERNLPVIAHAHRPEEIRRGLAAAPEYPDDIMRLIRERAANMAAGPLFWTPTIEGLFNYEYIRDNPEHIGRSGLARGAAAGHRRRHPEVAAASGAAGLLPRDAVEAADPGAEVSAAARSRRDSLIVHLMIAGRVSGEPRRSPARF